MFTLSAAVLVILVLSSAMLVIADVWIHLVSSTVVGEPLWTAPQDDFGNFSRVFGNVDEDLSQSLDGGFQTFLGLSPLNAVTQISNTTFLIPNSIPHDVSVQAETIGISLDCNLVNLDCTFWNFSDPWSFFCPTISPLANGPLGNANLTFLSPENGSNSTSFELLASMALPSPFNASSTTLAAQVFQCFGSVQNINYTSISGQLNITSLQAVSVQPLLDLWNELSLEVVANQSVVQNILNMVGQATLVTQVDGITTTPSVFTDGLSKFLVSFLSSQTSTAPALMVLAFFSSWSVTNISNQQPSKSSHEFPSLQ